MPIICEPADRMSPLARKKSLKRKDISDFNRLF
jgi:hypothetical protein